MIDEIIKYFKKCKDYEILVNGKDDIKIHFDHEKKTIDFINKGE